MTFFLKDSKSIAHLVEIFRTFSLFSGVKLAEAVAQRRSVKKVFLEILQNSQENNCARVSFLTKMQGSGLQLYLKMDSKTGVFV